MNRHTLNVILSLRDAGIAIDDCHALRRIAMTLQSWHEAECGTNNGGIERDETTGKTYWYNSFTCTRTPCRDRETGARKRLTTIMKKYPSLVEYVQGDPRGCSLYIVPREKLHGTTIEQSYNSGIAVF